MIEDGKNDNSLIWLDFSNPPPPNNIPGGIWAAEAGAGGVYDLGEYMIWVNFSNSNRPTETAHFYIIFAFLHILGTLF